MTAGPLVELHLTNRELVQLAGARLLNARPSLGSEDCHEIEIEKEPGGITIRVLRAVRP